MTEQHHPERIHSKTEQAFNTAFEHIQELYETTEALNDAFGTVTQREIVDMYILQQYATGATAVEIATPLEVSSGFILKRIPSELRRKPGGNKLQTDPEYRQKIIDSAHTDAANLRRSQTQKSSFKDHPEKYETFLAGREIHVNAADQKRHAAFGDDVEQGLRDMIGSGMSDEDIAIETGFGTESIALLRRQYDLDPVKRDQGISRRKVAAVYAQGYLDAIPKQEAIILFDRFILSPSKRKKYSGRKKKHRMTSEEAMDLKEKIKKIDIYLATGTIPEEDL